MKIAVRLIIALLFISAISFCSKKKSDPDVSEYINNQNITDEEAIYNIAKTIFKDQLKSFKSEKNTNGSQDVTIEFGGDRAYTFYSENSYSERIQFQVVRYIYLMFQNCQKRNIYNLRISAVKPYYVKEPNAKTEIVEEFEVFRASINIDKVKEIKNWENPAILREDKKMDKKLESFFNELRTRWTIEMNELYRIQVK